ncbi:MAG: dihydroorotate dehydrogenase [Candidatus Omnitrophota bacterium]|nr:dihydroorotate dehydrogenase [Candidatus Omnitrophota bacterium]
MKPNFCVNIDKLRLKNPVIVASGTFGYAEEFKDIVDLKKLGGIVSKTITLNPRKGNPPPRTCETPAGMLNSIGLENPGVKVFLKEKLPVLKKIGVPIIVSIASESGPEEFVSLAKQLDKIACIAAIELNISCPNVSRLAGVPVSRCADKLISQDADSTYALVNAVRKVTKKTLITKLSPNITDITEIASAAQTAGSNAVSLINTIAAMSIDIEKKSFKIASGVAGLSGPAIKPIAVRMVWEVYQKIKIPIIGMGGIMNTADAIEFFLAGSSAIAIGTANFINPGINVEIIDGIKKYMIKNKIKGLKNLTGGLII